MKPRPFEYHIGIVEFAFDVHGDDVTFTDEFAYGSIKKCRTAVSRTRFYDDVGFDAVDEFLDYDSVAWKLPERYTEPGGFFPEAVLFVLDVVFV